MHKFIAIHGLATHLSLVLIAPLLFLPFIPAADLACLLFASLSLVLIWLMMEPSVYWGESLHLARQRVLKDVRRDPLTWILLTLVVYSLLVAFNGGVDYRYGAEQSEWLVTAPRIPYLPGSITAAGWLPAAKLTGWALAVIAACRVFGRKAGFTFVLLLTVLFGLAGILWLFFRVEGIKPIPEGTVFGFALIFCAVATDWAFEQREIMALPFLAVATAGNLAGLIVFSTPITIAVLLGVWVLLTVYSLVRMRGSSVFFGGVGYPLLIAGTVLLSASLMRSLANPIMMAKFRTISSGAFFSETFFEVRALLSECARTAWMHSPWLGSGLDSFAIDMRLYLGSEAWAKIPSGPVPAFNGWWQMLAENGLVGAIVWLAPIVALIVQFVRSTIAAVKESKLSLEVATVVGPLTLLAFIALPFFNQRSLSVEALTFTLVLLAVSSRSVGSRTKEND